MELIITNLNLNQISDEQLNENDPFGEVIDNKDKKVRGDQRFSTLSTILL